MAPFVPFLVLIGNAIVISSDVDMALLNTALQLIQPVAIDSPMVRIFYQECEALHGVASSILARFS